MTIFLQSLRHENGRPDEEKQLSPYEWNENTFGSPLADLQGGVTARLRPSLPGEALHAVTSRQHAELIRPIFVRIDRERGGILRNPKGCWLDVGPMSSLCLP